MSLTTNQTPPYKAELGLLIDGQWRRAAQRFHAVIDPATEEVIAQLPLAETTDLDDALAAAQRGFEVWRKKSAVERGAVLGEVPESARIMNEEPFGPVVPMAGFDTLDEAIARANRLDVGLAAFAFTASDRQATI